MGNQGFKVLLNRRVGTGPSEKVVQEKTMWDEDRLDGISVWEAEEDISSSKESMHSSHQSVSQSSVSQKIIVATGILENIAHEWGE